MTRLPTCCRGCHYDDSQQICIDQRSWSALNKKWADLQTGRTLISPQRTDSGCAHCFKKLYPKMGAPSLLTAGIAERAMRQKAWSGRGDFESGNLNTICLWRIQAQARRPADGDCHACFYRASFLWTSRLGFRVLHRNVCEIGACASLETDK